MANAPSNSKFDLDALFAPAHAVEEYLSSWLDQRPLPTNLRDAVRYSLLGPGKRLRPILVVRSCEAVGGKAQDAMPAAAAIEMIHCFSLVHDDLPAMDNDDLRRGRPTLHKAAGEAMAILAGDLMNTMAFELLTARVQSPRLAAAVSHELAVASDDMIAGQVYDTIPQWPADKSPMDRLRTIHWHKTGALIRCACRMGALSGIAAVGKVGEKSGRKSGKSSGGGKIEALTKYAEAIGLMFQVVDDLLDVSQTTEQLGKTAGKDKQQGKLTYPGLIGIDASRDEVQRLRTEAISALAKLGRRAQPLRDLCEFMAVRTR